MTTLTFTAAAMAAELVLATVATTKLVFAAVATTELILASVASIVATSKLVLTAVTAPMAAASMTVRALLLVKLIFMVMFMQIANLLKLILELSLRHLISLLFAAFTGCSLFLTFLFLGSRLLLGFHLLFFFLGYGLLLLFLLSRSGGLLLLLSSLLGRLRLFLAGVDLISVLNGFVLSLQKGWILGWFSVHELGVLGLIDDAIHGRLELFALGLGQLMNWFFDFLGDQLSDLITWLVNSKDGLVDEMMDSGMHIVGFHVRLLLFSYLLFRLCLCLLLFGGLIFLLLLLDSFLGIGSFLLLYFGLLLLVFSLLLFSLLCLGLLLDFSFHFLLFFSCFNLLLHILDFIIDLFWILSASRFLILLCLRGGFLCELLSDLTFDLLELVLELSLKSIG